MTYVLPKPSSASLKTALLVPGVALIIIGLGVFGASFIVGRKRAIPPPVS